MYLNIARLWALRLPVAYGLAYVVGIGPGSIWWAMFVSNMVTAVIGLYYFHTDRWLNALDPDDV